MFKRLLIIVLIIGAIVFTSWYIIAKKPWAKKIQPENATVPIRIPVLKNPQNPLPEASVVTSTEDSQIAEPSSLPELQISNNTIYEDPQFKFRVNFFEPVEARKEGSRIEFFRNNQSVAVVESFAYFKSLNSIHEQILQSSQVKSISNLTVGGEKALFYESDRYQSNGIAVIYDHYLYYIYGIILKKNILSTWEFLK